MILSHFTCDHGHDGIQRDGVIRPFPQPFLGGVELSWWTDKPSLADTDPDMLGLQSTLLSCDRTEHHYLADVVAVPWIEYRRRGWLMAGFSTEIAQLEFGRAPGHWYVSTVVVEWAEHRKKDER